MKLEIDNSFYVKISLTYEGGCVRDVTGSGCVRSLVLVFHMHLLVFLTKRINVSLGKSLTCHVHEFPSLVNATFPSTKKKNFVKNGRDGATGATAANISV